MAVEAQAFEESQRIMIFAYQVLRHLAMQSLLLSYTDNVENIFNWHIIDRQILTIVSSNSNRHLVYNQRPKFSHFKKCLGSIFISWKAQVKHSSLCHFMKWVITNMTVKYAFFFSDAFYMFARNHIQIKPSLLKPFVPRIILCCLSHSYMLTSGAKSHVKCIITRSQEWEGALSLCDMILYNHECNLSMILDVLI